MFFCVKYAGCIFLGMKMWQLRVIFAVDALECFIFLHQKLECFSFTRNGEVKACPQSVHKLSCQHITVASGYIDWSYAKCLTSGLYTNTNTSLPSQSEHRVYTTRGLLMMSSLFADVSFCAVRVRAKCCINHAYVLVNLMSSSATGTAPNSACGFYSMNMCSVFCFYLRICL